MMDRLPDLKAISTLFRSRFGSLPGALVGGLHQYAPGLQQELLFRLKFHCMMDLLEDAWLAPEIPPDRLANARASFARLEEGEEPLALFEHPGLFLKSKGKKGLIVTTHGLHWYWSGEGERAQHVVYREMNPDHVKHNRSRHKASTIDLGMKGYEAMGFGWCLRRDLRGGFWDTFMPNEGYTAIDILYDAFAEFVKQASEIWKAGYREAECSLP